MWDFYNNSYNNIYVYEYTYYLCLYRVFRTIAPCLVFLIQCDSDRGTAECIAQS